MLCHFSCRNTSGVDKANLKRWDNFRVKTGCKDINKVPKVVEGLLDMHFYDFTFQREVVSENAKKLSWNTWTRTSESGEDDNPPPKKHKKADGKAFQGGSSDENNFVAGTSAQYRGKQHNSTENGGD
jgi:hypothetical protein